MVEFLLEGEMCERGRPIIDRMVVSARKRYFSNRRRKIINWVVEMSTKINVGHRRGKFFNWFVEIFTNVGDRKEIGEI